MGHHFSLTSYWQLMTPAGGGVSFSSSVATVKLSMLHEIISTHLGLCMQHWLNPMDYKQTNTPKDMKVGRKLRKICLQKGCLSGVGGG